MELNKMLKKMNDTLDMAVLEGLKIKGATAEDLEKAQERIKESTREEIEAILSVSQDFKKLEKSKGVDEYISGKLESYSLLSSGGLIIGSFMFFFGSVRWYLIQRKLDEKLDSELKIASSR